MWGISSSEGELIARAEPLLGLMAAVEHRSHDLYGHGEQVGRYCVWTAERLGIARDGTDALFLAGRLHDVGKAGVSEAVLAKPSSLSSEEWRQVKLHAEIGANFLFACQLGEAGVWVLAHHERLDGSGYPFGIEGEQIPVPARILAVADAYDAMRTNRVYRAAMSHEQAAEELRRGSGRQFDPAVVDAFLAILAVRGRNRFDVK